MSAMESLRLISPTVSAVKLGPLSVKKVVNDALGSNSKVTMFDKFLTVPHVGVPPVISVLSLSTA
jgi:hypothetical protein